MPSYYWIKLYIEILDDPKMGRLTDRLFRRAVQLFLIAGEYQRDGLLPSIDDIAWRLRPMSTDELETDLADLASVGIVHKTQDGWKVTNFEKRQSKVTAAERMRQYRERKQQELYYGDGERYEDVTIRNTEKIKIREDKDKDIEEIKTTDKNAIAAVSTAYENNIGAITPLLADDIKDLVSDYPLEWITYAIKTAVQSEKRSMRYIRGILRNIKREGFNKRDPEKVAVLQTADDINAFLESEGLI